jgi:SpoVK/Ycf46/Vps4 family AAA+-type ATPase
MQEVDWQIRSNRPLIYICSHEEERVLNAIEKICERKNKNNWTLYSWDITGNITSNNPSAPLPKNGEESDQLSILSWFDNMHESEDSYSILVLKDFQKFLQNGDMSDQIEKQVVRQLRNMCQSYKYKHKCIIIIGISLNLPPELQKLTTIIDWPLPEKEHIAEQIDKMIDTIKKRDDLKSFKTEYSDDEREEIISSLQGLTHNEIELLNSYVVLTRDHLSPLFLASRKREIIRESGLLDWRDASVNIENVGGMSEFKKWLKKRKNAFGHDAQEYGLPSSLKGVLALGIQGCGKSRLAEGLADYYKLPLLRMDVGKLFSGTLGSTEENIRMAIKVAESVSPCILWVDELEKGFSGTGNSNYADGGTTSRVFATFLTWMQTKTLPVILFATANDISSLPPELIRKGRFDEIFFVDLPLDEERKEIFEIHLKMRKRDATMFDMDSLVKYSDGFTGAEIEAAIVDAMYVGFDDNKREITTTDILRSLSETVPLSIQMKEQVSNLREWAKTRARHASLPRTGSFIQDEIKKIAITQPKAHKIAAQEDNEEL